MESDPTFEQGPIRPPSEAGSLLVRVTRNCPWNRCAFCSTYKGRKFSRRNLDEIKNDVDAARGVWDRIIEMSWKSGGAGEITREVLTEILQHPKLPDSFRSVAYWMASGGRTVFLQDANSLMLSTDTLVEILAHIRLRFPQVERVTSYARGITLKGKSVDEFIRLKEAGLTRLHVGMESGSDKVLKLIQKGVRSDQLIDGGRKVVAGGVSLCLYVIPGIGGTELSRENALESARVVNAINPAHLRFRSLYVRRGSRLEEMVRNGEFTPPDEDRMVLEIRTLIENLNGISTTIVSDHVLNLLEEVEGTVPHDKTRILAVIDKYLSMSDGDRQLFQLGRRGGALRSVNDLEQHEVLVRLRDAKTQIEKEMPGGIPEYMEAVKRRFV
ncbi:MAG: radical SAM protein [Desulfomonile tiedjei]|uniref:Radical SAM protein n=1 Tax=Desulfomonile tiedjei TaxID=2358 RepID=A0A9D6V2A1_9BACT|nr:radical SAM protein [Desulfomonile tiedjei]